MTKDKRFEIIRILMAVLIAFGIAFAIMLFISDQPLDSFITFITGPLSGKRYIGNVIETAIPLIFAGLATCVVFQANLFYFGAEGIFYFSGLIAAIIGIYVALPKGIHPVVAIIVAGIVGALIAGFTGVLKAKWNASELVTSLMLNNILLGIGLYILNYVLRDPKALAIASVKFPNTANLSRILPGTRVHTGIIIALVMVVLTYLFLYKTKWGYALRMTGLNREFANYSGINTFWVIIYAHLISGFIAGMGGATQVLGMHTRFEWTTLLGYGFDGALIAMLAKNNPIGVIGSAFFLAYIRVGADMIARMSDIPSEMVSILQAVIILLISAERFLSHWRQRKLLKEAK